MLLGVPTYIVGKENTTHHPTCRRSYACLRHSRDRMLELALTGAQDVGREREGETGSHVLSCMSSHDAFPPPAAASVAAAAAAAAAVRNTGNHARRRSHRTLHRDGDGEVTKARSGSRSRTGEETVRWRWGINPMLAGPLGFFHTTIVGQADEQTGKKNEEKIIQDELLLRDLQSGGAFESMMARSIYTRSVSAMQIPCSRMRAARGEIKRSPPFCGQVGILTLSETELIDGSLDIDGQIQLANLDRGASSGVSWSHLEGGQDIPPPRTPPIGSEKTEKFKLSTQAPLR
ncbi:hypothetical protein BDP55DRAFT_713941 [Colletotrichum godetiae]|uniref:Uncharacterized protein n=1 Tax=Colletotrichum godetiae TaxID=1209918 RepID=A0AAJ0AQ38_9PEZI|nr:uncharacterized protein BDP55DRAFT_713941 [Colletotrichum godetiae]KAK1687602.1 hypothetical protein BDP55DRAFT_713941 [Colletotrichum godetiae]